MSLFAELRRRNVFRVGIAYVVIAWLVLQVGEVLGPALRLPEWTNSALAFFLILGLPVALFFAWIFELTPEGVKFERDIDRSQSITTETAKKVNRVIIVVLVVAVAFFAFDKFVLDPSRDAELVEAAAEAVVEETAIERNSIAVLPFVDLSPDGDQEYFSDGIAEEILNVLVRVEDLSVASRTSAFGFKGQEALGIPLIAEKLMVRHILEGSVRKAGDTVRITAQLIDAQTDAHLWSETYDRKLTAESIFAIQDEIAQAIVNQLGVVMDEASGPVETQNLDAYEQYLRAHKLFIERSSIPGAIAAFEQAVAADPEFARAQAGLAAVYVIAPSWGQIDRDYYELATDVAERAIELNPDLALPYAVVGYALKERMPADFKAASDNYDKALELDPNEATVWLWRGLLNVALGYFDRARSDIERCLELDPAYQNCRRHLVRVEYYAGNATRALELQRELALGGFRGAGGVLLHLHAALGEKDLVLWNIAGFHSSLGIASMIPYEFAAVTDPDFDFESQRQEIETLFFAETGDELDWGPEDVLSPLTFGVYDVIEPQVFWPVWWAPYPVKFAESPHPKRLIRELGLPEFWRENGFPPQCRPVGDDDFECDVARAKASEKTQRGAPL